MSGRARRPAPPPFRSIGEVAEAVLAAEVAKWLAARREKRAQASPARSRPPRMRVWRAST